MRTNSTNKAAFERMQRVSAILNKRVTGMSLAQIGAEEPKPVSPQAIHSLIQRALAQMPQQSVAEIRLLEADRLDAMLKAVWQRALDGDLQAVAAVLAIMRRRASLLGLDLQPSVLRFGDRGVEEDQPVLRVEIVNNPEEEKMRWLEEERMRLMSDPPRSVN